jgi:hypothetical protein
MGVPALTTETPYALANGTLSTRAGYREIGAMMAREISSRLVG